VFRARGSVNVKDKQGNWRVIPSPDGAGTVGDGETLKTGDDGEAILEGGGETRVGVGPGTEGTVGEEDGIKVPVLNLPCGSAYCSVLTKAKKAGVSFKIQTDVGVTSVTGAELLVRKQASGFTVFLSESSCVVGDREGKRATVPTGEAGFVRPWAAARFSAVGAGPDDAAAGKTAAAILVAEVHRLALDALLTVGDRARKDPGLATRIADALAGMARRDAGPPQAGKVVVKLTVEGAALKKELEKLLGVALGSCAVGTTRTLPEGAMAEIGAFRKLVRG